MLLVSVVGFSCAYDPAPSVRDAPISSAEGMMEYLRGRQLPGVEGVERWENIYGSGIKIETAHYSVYTTLLDPLMLSRVPAFLESAYAAYNAQLPHTVRSTEPFKAYLFSDRGQWEEFTKKFAGKKADIYLKITAGAYCLKGSSVAYNIGRHRTFSVLGHEGWHQFNKRHFKYRLPSWLDEGIATQFESSAYQDGRFSFTPGRNLARLAALKLTLNNGEMIDLEQLISMNPGEALLGADQEVRAFYAQSYALIRFLKEQDYGVRLGDYYTLLVDGLEGDWPLNAANKEVAVDRNIPLTIRWNRQVGHELFRDYILADGDFDQLEKEYENFCRKIVYHVRLR